MSSHTYINDEWIGGITIWCDSDEPIVNITSREHDFALRLNEENLDALIRTAGAARAMLRNGYLPTAPASDIPLPATPEPMEGAQ